MNNYLESLDRIKSHLLSEVGGVYKTFTNSAEYIKEDLLVIEKVLKAFEITVEKEVDMRNLLFYLKQDVSDDYILYMYNTYAGDDYNENYVLTQEELQSFKGVLTWGKESK